MTSCKSYVFGFSNGHAGTTTLSEPATYAGSRRLNSTGFAFEVGGRKYALTNRATDSVQREIEHVRNVYLPALWKIIEGKKTVPHGAQLNECVDLSHFNLFFFRGLLHVMRELQLPFKLVRLRRDAVELSRSFGDPDLLWVAFRPFEAPHARVLQLARPKKTWNNMTWVHKGLWMVDEVESQWLKNVNAHEKTEALVQDWSKYDDNTEGDPFVHNAAMPIAKFLGLSLSDHLEDDKQHGTTRPTARELKEDLEILRSYQSLMRAECANFPALAPEMPSSRALGLRKAALEGLDQW